MTVYMKREDVPTACASCRFDDGWGECVLLPAGHSYIGEVLEGRREDCPIRRVDELGASAEVKIAADGVTCQAADPMAVAEEYREELAKVRERAEVVHSRYKVWLDRDDVDAREDDINTFAAVDALLELLAACGIGGEGHET